MTRQSKHPEAAILPPDLLVHHLKKAASVLALMVALVGAGHLVAWLSGYLAGLGVSTITMKTNAALCLMLSGIALLLLMPEQPSPWRLRIGRVLALALGTVGLLTFIENSTGWNFGLDQLLATELPGALGVATPNRMGLPASASFVLAGLSLLIISRRRSSPSQAAQWLALSICLLALLGTIGHLYGAQSFYADTPYTTIAWPTAAALLMLGVSLLLARPAAGLMSQVSAADPGGANLRRWLPVLLLPVVLGWLRLAGERARVFDAATGTAMMMIIFIVALAVLAYTGARGVSRSSAESVTSAEFLKIVNQAADSRELVHAAVTFLHRQSQCEAIGIRLKDGDDFPYYEARGFPEEFVMLENSLCDRDPTGKIQRDSVGNPRLACMCGNVICGRFDPSKDFFTANGSFWTNSTTRLLAGTTETEWQGRTRNRCNGQGYESVALIPLGSGHRRLGLIQINDKRMGMFTPRLIALWERLAGYLTVALAKLRAEEAMRQSEERLRLFIEHAPAALAMFDREMRYLSVSRRWLRDYGLEGRDVHGVSYYALSPEIPDRWREIHRRGLAGDVVQADEDSFQRADGSMQWLRWEVRPWQDASGQVGGIVIFSEDITDGKRAEQALRQTVTEMERSNKELEQFAYICAHDLQEPLRQVRGFVGLIKERHADRLDGKAAQYFDFVSDGAARMSALVSGLLAYSRVRMGEKRRKLVSCQQALQAALANLSAAIDKTNARIIYDELPGLTADPTQLTQLFQNLIGNAIKYHRDGIPPELHIGCRYEDGGPVICVRDNGIGIAPEHHEQVFQIFKRLHGRDKYPGTGIGLAICKRIVEEHGGKIWIESNVGEGAAFFFRFSESS